MHKQPKDLSMPEDLRFGPRAKVGMDSDAEGIAGFPVQEPEERAISQEIGRDQGLML